MIRRKERGENQAFLSFFALFLNIVTMLLVHKMIYLIYKKSELLFSKVIY